MAIELEIPDELYANLKRTIVTKLRDTRLAIGKDPENGELTIVNETLWLCPEPRGTYHLLKSHLFLANLLPPTSVLVKHAPKGWYKVVIKNENGSDSFQVGNRRLEHEPPS